jgi:hypothetical protein
MTAFETWKKFVEDQEALVAKYRTDMEALGYVTHWVGDKWDGHLEWVLPSDIEKFTPDQLECGEAETFPVH